MIGHCLLQIVRSLISCLQKQGSGLSIDESKDAVVHVFDVTRHRPIETFLKGVECPKTCIVALGGDDLMPSDDGSHFARQFVRTSHMTRKHSNDVLPKAIDTHHRRIFVLVLHERRNCPDTNAHRSDEDKGIEVLPLITHFCALNGLGFQLSLQSQGNILPCLADLNNSYLHGALMMFFSNELF